LIYSCIKSRKGQNRLKSLSFGLFGKQFGNNNKTPKAEGIAKRNDPNGKI
jgi:hypothetical protein